MTRDAIGARRIRSDTKRTMRRTLSTLALAFAPACFAVASADAQSVAPPPTQFTLDPNGVDVVSGLILLQSPMITIGQPGMGGLSYQRTYDSSINDWRDNLTGSINSSGATYTVTMMGASETFTLSGSTFTSTEGRGGTLTVAGSTYTYTRSDGAVGSFDTTKAGLSPVQANVARITTLTMPSGEILSYTYTVLSGAGFSAQRLQSVTNNLGYQISLTYQTSNADATGITLTKATAINNAVEYCSPAANGCTLSNAWPSLTFGTENNSRTQTVTDSLGQVSRYTFSSGRVVAITLPNGDCPNRLLTYNSDGQVSAVMNGLVSWQYAYTLNGTQQAMIVTDPLRHIMSYVSNISTDRLTSIIDQAGHTTSFTYDGQNRRTRITQPEGNYVNYTLDSRGNVTLTRFVAKAGSGLSDIVTSAAYDASCTNSVTCNQPNSTTDARGYRTDYTYATTHGGLLTVTQPAPSGATPVGTGTRPQTRYGYTQLFAWYKNNGGTIAQAPGAVYRLTSTSACATRDDCNTVHREDETASSISYGTGSSSVAINLLPLSVSSGAGDTSLTATVAATYDSVGNVASIDGPLSGSSDTIVFHYDANRLRTGVVGPDPDGGGSLHNRALRTTYNALGEATRIERGTVNSQSDPDWANFSSIEELDYVYDSEGRRIRQGFVSGGTTFNVSQYSYDDAGHVQCMAVRMNAAIFGSLPESACTLGTEGSNGPDQITQNSYDTVGRLTQVTSGLGTSLSQNTLTQTWTNNSRLATVADANSSLTTYEYDGFDRLSKIRFPNTSGGGSSTTDYKQYGYDSNTNVTSDRRRDGNSIAITYDNLNRTGSVDAPAGTQDVAYTYDNFGRLLTAGPIPPNSGQTLTYVYDQLSRLLSETNSSPSTTVSYQYDLAGHRTRITWPDTSFWVQYDYDPTGEVTAIKENNTTNLATYAYNNLGQRTSITRGNNVTTSYSYDSAQRLSSLAHDLASTGSDETLSYTYSASNQQLTRTGTNASYVYTPPQNYATTPANGLNQITSVNGTSMSYDGRGNLTSDGTTSYSYDSFNRLTGAGTATFGYDRVGRLYQTTASGVTTNLLYDGVEAIGEYNASGTLLRRFVHGPGIDEPIVWYEGSGTSDRRWLIENEQNSVIAITNSSGAALNIDTYDEYGAPGTSNVGRFQYTGQMWLPEASLYHYKARVYSPALGRFMQTDPIWQAGGLNLYTYVGNDPVNYVDPFGLQEACDDAVVCVTAPLSGGAVGVGGNHTPSTNGEPREPQERNHDEIVVTADCNASVACQQARYNRWMQQYGNRFSNESFLQFLDVMSLGVGVEVEALRWGGELLAHCFCFVEGTEVATPTGERTIEDLRVGDEVLTWDPQSGETSPQRVTALIRPPPQATYELRLRDAAGETEAFRVSGNHPWFVSGRGWVHASDLTPGMSIARQGGADLAVTSIAGTGRTEQTYNLEVAGSHVFLVGRFHAVVHNGVCDLLARLYGDFASKLTHVFRPDHNLDALVSKFGSREDAFMAIHQAAQSLVGQGTVRQVVNVGGIAVTVEGTTVNGVFRVGSAWIPGG